MKIVLGLLTISALGLGISSCGGSGDTTEKVDVEALAYQVRPFYVNRPGDSDVALSGWISQHSDSNRSWIIIIPLPASEDTGPLTNDDAIAAATARADVTGSIGPTSFVITDPAGLIEIDGKKIRLEPGRALVLANDGSVNMLSHPANLYITWLNYFEATRSILRDEAPADLGPVWNKELKLVAESIISP